MQTRKGMYFSYHQTVKRLRGICQGIRSTLVEYFFFEKTLLTLPTYITIIFSDSFFFRMLRARKPELRASDHLKSANVNINETPRFHGTPRFEVNAPSKTLTKWNTNNTKASGTSSQVPGEVSVNVAYDLDDIMAIEDLSEEEEEEEEEEGGGETKVMTNNFFSANLNTSQKYTQSYNVGAPPKLAVVTPLLINKNTKGLNIHLDLVNMDDEMDSPKPKVSPHLVDSPKSTGSVSSIDPDRLLDEVIMLSESKEKEKEMEMDHGVSAMKRGRDRYRVDEDEDEETKNDAPYNNKRVSDPSVSTPSPPPPPSTAKPAIIRRIVPPSTLPPSSANNSRTSVNMWRAKQNQGRG
jgi:hypothetical protein